MSGYDNEGYKKSGLRADGYWVEDPKLYRDKYESPYVQSLYDRWQKASSSLDFNDANDFNQLRALTAQKLAKDLEGRVTDEDFKRIQAVMPGLHMSREAAMQHFNVYDELLRRYQNDAR